MLLCISYACWEGHTSVVNTLAQHGADIEIKANRGMQPIHCAAHNGHAETVSTHPVGH